MLNIVLFGPPGAGKGTQSAKLIEKYKLIHLSTGDIFRANIKGATKLGVLAKSYMDRGHLVPDEVTIKMLESELDKNKNANGFIFDGFPRTSAQATALDVLLAKRNTSITMMLALEVEEKELKKRLLLRGKDSGRPDDQNPDIIQNRINVYNRETAPVKSFYSDKNKFYSVKGIGTIDNIFDDLCAVIDSKSDNNLMDDAKEFFGNMVSSFSKKVESEIEEAKKEFAPIIKQTKKAVSKRFASVKKEFKKEVASAKKQAKPIVAAAKKKINKEIKSVKAKANKQISKAKKEVSSKKNEIEKKAKTIINKAKKTLAKKALEVLKETKKKKSLKPAAKKTIKKQIKKAVTKKAKPVKKSLAKVVKKAVASKSKSAAKAKSTIKTKAKRAATSKAKSKATTKAKPVKIAKKSATSTAKKITKTNTKKVAKALRGEVKQIKKTAKNLAKKKK